MAGEEGCARSPEENNREKMANDIRMMEIFVSGRKITCSPSADSQGKVTFDDDFSVCTWYMILVANTFHRIITVLPSVSLHSPCFVVLPDIADFSPVFYPDLLLLPAIFLSQHSK